MVIENETKEFYDKMAAAADRGLTYGGALERRNRELVQQGEELMKTHKIVPESPWLKLQMRVKNIIARFRNSPK